MNMREMRKTHSCVAMVAIQHVEHAFQLFQQVTTLVPENLWNTGSDIMMRDSLIAKGLHSVQQIRLRIQAGPQGAKVSISCKVRTIVHHSEGFVKSISPIGPCHIVHFYEEPIAMGDDGPFPESMMFTAYPLQYFSVALGRRGNGGEYAPMNVSLLQLVSDCLQEFPEFGYISSPCGSQTPTLCHIRDHSKPRIICTLVRGNTRAKTGNPKAITQARILPGAPLR